MAQTVCIDFDGTLAQYKGWTGVLPTEPPMPGAVEAVMALIAQGYQVVVFSTRAQYVEGEAAIASWLQFYNFPPMRITDKKIPAIAYVDDRAVEFAGDWNYVANKIKELANK